mmetsp:Transcript_55875/g.130797  ORF Transcript_55875/g.130797 Transcript_55875/m.130797 type:complete len:788 (-) Transcript_55875:316-2679(-)
MDDAESCPQSYHVTVPEGVKEGNPIRFEDASGADWSAFTPVGLAAGEVFEVHVKHGMAFQPQSIKVPDGVTPGTVVHFPGLAGEACSAAVPEGVEPGQCFLVWHQLHRCSQQDGSNPHVWAPMEVAVPDASNPGQVVRFNVPDGTCYSAHVPHGAEPGTKFVVYLHGGRAWQTYPVAVPADVKPGDPITFLGLDGRPHTSVVPVGAEKSGTFMAWSWTAPIPPPPPTEELLDEELKPWLEAAASFQMNEDFQVDEVGDEPISFVDFLERMKASSEGKPTIQALGDKILLSQMVANLNIPELPMLMHITDAAEVEAKVEAFIDERALTKDACSVFLKPSHLSSGAGVLQLPKALPELDQSCFQPVTEDEKQTAAALLKEHIPKFLSERAAPTESRALQSLKSGFLAQPRYDSVVKFEWPLELRIVVLWGKARLGVWWWCRDEGLNGTTPQRNAWLVRRPLTPGQLSDDDEWCIAHDHPGGNVGFDSALKLFKRHMSAMAGAAEYLTTAIGAPFLRVDFFVGSPRFGIRLNEVAYGSTVEHRRFPRGVQDLVNCKSNGQALVDDSPAIARILQEGMKVCKEVLPRKRFLERVGIRGNDYEVMHVKKLAEGELGCIPAVQELRSLAIMGDKECESDAASAEMCITPRTADSVNYPNPAWQGGEYGTQGYGGKLCKVDGIAQSQNEGPACQTEGDETANASTVDTQKSKDQEEITLTFENRTAVDISIQWTHPKSGAKHICMKLTPGHQATIQTFHGHEFAALGSGDAILRSWRVCKSTGPEQRFVFEHQA